MGDGANWQSSSGSNGTKAEDMNLIKLLIETDRPAWERLIAEARRRWPESSSCRKADESERRRLVCRTSLLALIPCFRFVPVQAFDNINRRQPGILRPRVTS